MRSFAIRTALLALVALSGFGCMEPLQSGGVNIIGDPSSRMEVLCRLHERPGDPFCAASDSAARAAEGQAGDEGFLD